MLLLTIVQIAIVLLDVLWWIIVLQVILSWLIAFNVMNTSHQGVRRFLAALDRFLEPLYRPIRRILPDFGGIDFSPLVLLLALSILSQIVLRNLAYSLAASGTA
jgi:YggT family protein